MNQVPKPAVFEVSVLEPIQANADDAVVDRLAQAISSWYVRKDRKYFAIDRLHVKLAREDVVQACLHRIQEEFSDVPVTDSMIKEAFRTAIDKRIADKKTSIPI